MKRIPLSPDNNENNQLLQSAPESSRMLYQHTQKHPNPFRKEDPFGQPAENSGYFYWRRNLTTVTTVWVFRQSTELQTFHSWALKNMFVLSWCFKLFQEMLLCLFLNTPKTETQLLHNAKHNMVANLNLICISILTPHKLYFTSFLKAQDLCCFYFHLFSSPYPVFSLSVITLYPHSDSHLIWIIIPQDLSSSPLSNLLTASFYIQYIQYHI